MAGVSTIVRKEVADHLSSKRFWILFALIYIAGLSASYVSGGAVKGQLMQQPEQEHVFLSLYTSSTAATPPFIFFVGYFGPIVGLALGFDAVNRELSSGTLSRVLSQPVHRDTLINGKFLAGLLTIALMMGSIVILIGGLGLSIIGAPPGPEEALRVGVFAGISAVYIGVWLSIAMLFSILFRRIATSALAAVAVWIFFSFFMFILADMVANSIVPITRPISQVEPELLIAREEVRRSVMLLSPLALFEEATIVILVPVVRALTPSSIIFQQSERILANPLPLEQSLLLVWPHLTAMVAGIAVLFAVSYVLFMKKEIRPGWA